MPYFVLPPEPPQIARVSTPRFISQQLIPPQSVPRLPAMTTVEASPPQLLAQSIVPAADGVGTQVSPQGNRFDITGGQMSSNGANLFHSFYQFGLRDGQIANFLTHAQTLNVLSRVVGGQASLINGRLQITGSQANLFLINPAGIIFGRNATLQVPGAFMATTANRLGLGAGPGGPEVWLDAIGANDYATLVGTPTSFAFTTATAGTIVNAGNLAVGQGQSLTLLGGTVINTGTLLAPGGQVTIAAIPGEHLVRLSQANSLLSLELSTLPPADSPLPPVLPALLTGGDLTNATGLTVNPNGTVQLTGSGRPVTVAPGTALVSGQVSVRGGLPASHPQITVVGDRIALLAATLDASGTQAGTIRIGGNYQGLSGLPTAQFTYVDALTAVQADGLAIPNDAIPPAVAGGNIILWSDKVTEFSGTITARGGPAAGNGGFVEVSSKGSLAFKGAVDVTATSGTTGTLLLDPTNIIIQAAGANDNQLNAGVPNAADPVGAIFAADGGAVDFTLSAAVLSSQAGNVILEATNNITIASGVSLNFAAGAGSITFTADADRDGVGAFTMDATQTIRTPGRNLAISGASLNLGNIDTSNIAPTNSAGGTVTLTARNGSVTVGTITTSASATPPGVPTAIAGNVTIDASTGITAGSMTAFAIAPAGVGTVATGGTVNLTARNGDISFSSIDTRGSTAATSTGGNVSLSANGVIRGTATGDTISTASPTQSGSVTIRHNGGPTNLPFVVGATSGNGTTGAINAGGASVITAGTFPIPSPGGGSAVVGTVPNTITITGINQVPTLTLNQTLTGGGQNQPFTFTYADLAPVITDADLDQTFLVITAINSGTLTVNGVTATVGTIIPQGAILVYTPPNGVTGLISGAFAVAGSDRLGLSNATAGQININVSAPSIIPPTIPGENNNGGVSTLATVLQGPPGQVANSTTLTLSGLPCNAVDLGVSTLDSQYSQEYEEYLGKQVGASKDRFLAACEALNQVEAATGVKPAIIYVSFVPTGWADPPPSQSKSLPQPARMAQLSPENTRSPGPSNRNSNRGDHDQLEIVAVVPNGQPIYRRVSGATRARVLEVARQFTQAITDPITRQTTAYLDPAQQLYRWLVQPLEADLQKRQVDNLVFIMDAGLRSLPLAALHDGNGFLVERYSLGLMPSLSLTDTRHRDVKTAQVLAMGASQFAEQRPLPAVPVELNTIFQASWAGKAFLNEQFTLSNLKDQRQQTPYGIIHLATHAEFKPGTAGQSYIQLWNSKLQLDQVRQLGWNSPPVELLVLSACRTALGDTEAELGFAGLAYQTGVRSALASLWAVDDEGTLAFMAEFYQRLQTTPIKAAALRDAQLAMIRKQVRFEEGKLITSAGTIPLPPELELSSHKDLSFPFYWAGLTLVGNPW